MEECISLKITVEATLIIDREEWPEGWNIKKEVGHQMSFSDAEEWEIREIVITGASNRE